ncbi:MAG: hypothetical protein AAGC69_12925, partial [Paracraurococcus sp.]
MRDARAFTWSLRYRAGVYHEPRNGDETTAFRLPTAPCGVWEGGQCDKDSGDAHSRAAREQARPCCLRDAFPVA